MIIQYLASGEERKAAEIADYLGLSPARTRALLLELVKENLIIPVGNSRKRRYTIPANE